jgi:glutamate/tyrosine decarboxylase-like PLP-dependent enzyme
VNLRLIETNEDFEIDTLRLIQQIDQDIADGLAPTIVVANIGTVNTGAIDPLPRLLEIARDYKLWLHADGAFGAIARISSGAGFGLERLAEVDSLAFDLHKWLYQQYDLGCIIVRSAEQHRAAFSLTPSYLRSATEGLTSGPMDFSAFAPRLSRSFSALRAWFSFKHNGFDAHRNMVDKNLRQAAYLTQKIHAADRLELLAPTRLNVVNFRFNPLTTMNQSELNCLNERIVTALQIRGIAAPSTTLLKGNLSIRVAIVNHRSNFADFDELVAATIRIGEEFATNASIQRASEQR